MSEPPNTPRAIRFSSARTHIGLIIIFMLGTEITTATELELDLEVRFRYRLTLTDREREVAFNVTSPQTWVHISMNTTGTPSIRRVYPSKDKPDEVYPSAINPNNAGMSVALFPPMMNLDDCSPASVCRFVVTRNNEQVGSAVLANVTHGRMIRIEQRISETTMTSKSTLWGFAVTEDRVPLIVQLEPQQAIPSADADLIVYEGRNLDGTDPKLPDGDTNFVGNNPESVKISSVWDCNSKSKYGCLYVAEVFVPESSGTPETSYKLETYEEGESSQEGFHVHIMWMAAAITILFLSLTSAVIVFFRMRAALVRQIVAQRQGEAIAAAGAPGPIAVAAGEERGVTRTQIKRLKIRKFKQNTKREELKLENSEAPDDMRCTICLADYEHGERVIGLPCGHDFHGECVAPWLEAKHRCPLCRQHLDTAEAKMAEKEFFGEADIHRSESYGQKKSHFPNESRMHNSVQQSNSINVRKTATPAHSAPNSDTRELSLNRHQPGSSIEMQSTFGLLPQETAIEVKEPESENRPPRQNDQKGYS